MSQALKDCVRDIPDFPKEGIIFKDITPVLKDGTRHQELIDLFYEYAKDKQCDVIAGIESRGFLLGSTLAYKLGASFVPVRKKGKLPYKTISQSYQLEYGEDHLEIHEDSIAQGDRVLIVDDLLATGGTSKATVKLIEQLGGEIVGLAYFIELGFLNGREQLSSYDIHTILKY